jgi:5-formyltetrahydrofolate cyclo-ligase
MSGRKDQRLLKEALRTEMRARRASIEPRERTRMARSVEDRLASLPEFSEARTVLLFYSFGAEVGTGGVAERVHSAGRRLLLPYLADETMEAAEVLPGDELVPTTYGPKEPGRRVAVDPGEVDLVVTPGLAFDRAGRRLGYGGGYYDRYLARLRPDAARVGIAFSLQVVDEVPAGPADEPVHLVVTDIEVIDSRPGAVEPETSGGPL